MSDFLSSTEATVLAWSLATSVVDGVVEAEVAPPEPVAPIDETGLLPVVVLAGFGLLVLGLTAGAVVHIRRIVAADPDGGPGGRP